MSTGTELRAVFYARVSTEEEKQLNALEKQIQENKDVIRDHGWRLVGEYIDEGKTGNGRGVNAYSDPLSGKIYCGSCGRKLWKHASNGYVNWMCASQVAKGDVECNGTRITTVAIRNIYKKITDNLEVNKGVVKQDIVKWLNELKATLSDTSVNEKIQKDLDKLERKRTKLLEAYLEDFISKDDYKAKYEAIEGQIEEKKKLLVPVEENEDIKAIESVLQNIDDEIDAYVKTLDMEESKVDFLIEHTKRITVLENRDIIIELDLVAGAIIAGKDFLLYVHDTMPLPHVRVPPKGSGGKTKPHFPLRDRFRCHQQRRNLERHRQSDLPAGAGRAEEAWDRENSIHKFFKKTCTAGNKRRLRVL